MDVVSALRSFLRVTETGSFSAAALDLGLTQPAISRQISALEGHYGVRLFHRSTSALALAIEGERMIPMAQRVIEAVDALGESATSDGKKVAGKVRLSLPAPLGLYLSERLPALLRTHPGLSVELMTREEPSDLVGDGIDLEVRIGEITDAGLIFRRIGWTTAFLVASPDYLQGRKEPSHPFEVVLHDCICYVRGGDRRVWSFSGGAEEIRVSLTPRLTCNNATAVHRAVLGGGGLAILSHIVVEADLREGRLINLLPDFPPVRLPINVVYASRRHISLRVRTVLDFLTAAVRADQEMRSSLETP
ncbi:LysR family transcriptional regulator [Agrobacterium sp. NPDC090283]|uniref:LysR family transcriptional regulator n=1 Tax=Agrobacterium sp. NPDC090283 TaxID=3363920 RepID=UPI00383A5925